jgi:hypothetical protein
MTDKIDIQNWRSLEPKVRTLWRVTNALTAVGIGALAVPADFIVRKAVKTWPLFSFAIPLIAFVFFLVLSQWLVNRTYEAYKYQVGDDDLAVAKGVFWKSWRFINRNRIQHVDLTAGPISRMLGLVEVSIFVGGMQGAAATIPGLSQLDAEALRSKLVQAEAGQSMVIAPPMEAPAGE